MCIRSEVKGITDKQFSGKEKLALVEDDVGVNIIDHGVSK